MSSSQPTVASSGHANLGTPHDDPHKYRRFFIGPMPEKIISSTKALLHRAERRGLHPSVNRPDNKDDCVSLMVKDQAFNFFIHEGGKAEDWEESQETNTIEEMLKRWRDSEWGRTLLRRKESHHSGVWVGCSFEIGNFLGVNTINDDAAPGGREREASQGSRNDTSSFTTERAAQRPTPAPMSTKSPPVPNGLAVQSMAGLHHLDTRDAESQSPISVSSSTALLRPPLDSRRAPSSSKLRTVLRSSSFVSENAYKPKLSESTPISIALSRQKGKGKGRMVHYSDLPITTQGPSPPADVLARTGKAVEDTSAGAAEELIELRWGDVVLRDRMLVRVSFTKCEALGSPFNETQNRRTSQLQYEDWAEHMVVWRRDCIEIYEDYSIPWKEYIKGHKSLAFVVPLKSSRTRLSMYSFVDLTFCITCPPAAIVRGGKRANMLYHQVKDGTNIYIFKVKSRTRALDWIWKLWRYLGGQIPSSIEIRNPGLDVRVKIDIPNEYTNQPEGEVMFTGENMIRLCVDALKSTPDWEQIVLRQIEQGKSLALAWRMDTKLDWVWQHECVDGTRRNWAVLCGLALKQKGKAPYLEIRLAEHFPTSLHTRDGTYIQEPAAIEGYVARIRPNPQLRKLVYLSTHDGNLFSISRTHAHPPSPPGLHTVDNVAPISRQTEVRRGTFQIMNAIGVSDLRDIVAIRRAFHIVPHRSHNEAIAEDGGDKSRIERSPSDDEDEGGADGMARSADKPRLKMMRSFELLFRNGRIVRFETHSRRVALEWIDRLRALIVYWRQRHRVDTSGEMDLAKSFRPPITPLTRACQDNDTPPQDVACPTAPLPSLSRLYDWCVIKGCRPIVKGGKVFTRRGLHGPYKLVQMFLLSGHVVLFHINQHSTLHYRQPKNISLLDAYICSGYFAALALPEGQYNPTAPPVPRRYQDGLEADDPEEDMLFMIWHRPQTVDINPGTESIGNEIPVPKTLSVKRNVLVCRTRSRLERDAWCWALNCEIEKIVRSTKPREDKSRTTGGLIDIR